MSLRRPAVASLLSLLALSAAPATQPSPPVYLWVEAESPTVTNIRPHPWYTNAVHKDRLSGNNWLAHFDGTKQGTASYTFTAPQPGTYTLWIRANSTAAKLAYTLNRDPEKEVDFSGHIDNINIASNDAPDLRFIAWVRVGEVTLTQRRNTLAFRTHSDNNNHGALDCFVLVQGKWRPEGTRKPDQSAPVAEQQTLAGAWPFAPADDDFNPSALLDLSSLNEKVAGETGFVRLSTADGGMSFIRGDGTPIRFWSVVSDGVEMSPDDMETHCRFLAKRGVNMVRLHLGLPDTTAGAKISALSEKQLDRAYRFISIAKKHGIYITLSPYWAHLTAPASWNLPGYAGQSPWGLLFYNPDLQAAYLGWLTEIYTRPNPYTGVPLKDEPALAIAQVQNEDSLLFYTFQATKPEQKKVIGTQFARWATKKYGSLDKALAAWGGSQQQGDDLTGGVLGFHLVWELANKPPASPGEDRRMSDQTQFLAETQHAFNARVEKHLRDLGAKQIVNAGNWRSADPVRLDDAERWSYTANEVIAANVYAGGLHTGDNNGYRIDPGHTFTNKSLLKHPEEFPGNLKQPLGHPFVITEVAWTHPNLYQSEAPFMAAAYMSLTGVDSFYWFAANVPTFILDPRRTFWKVGDSYALDKWSCSTPTAAAQWPAYALAYRRGYIAPATRPVVYEERAPADLWARRVPLISESGKFDPNRDPGAFAPQSPIKQEIDRLAFLVGPVVVKYDGDPRNSKVLNLTKYIDRANKRVTSVTGELTLDYGQGLLTVNTPKFQGVAGFLGSAKYQLADVSLQSANDYATVGVVSMDDLPIATSKKLLLQVGTTARLTGWTTAKATFKANDTTVEGERIVSTGSPPWQVADTKLTLTVRNPALTQATLLDPNGYAVKQLALQKTPTAITLTLPPNAMYIVLQ